MSETEMIKIMSEVLEWEVGQEIESIDPNYPSGVSARDIDRIGLPIGYVEGDEE